MIGSGCRIWIVSQIYMLPYFLCLLDGDEEIINTPCWMWWTQVEAQKGAVGRDWRLPKGFKLTDLVVDS